MSYKHKFRISAHAIIVDDDKKILLLKQTYGDKKWGLPGGSPEPPENIEDTLLRECKEELGCSVEIEYLSGVYFHRKYDSYVFIYKCKNIKKSAIKLSREHSDYRFVDINELNNIQRQRVTDCLEYNGVVKSRIF